MKTTLLIIGLYLAVFAVQGGQACFSSREQQLAVSVTDGMTGKILSGQKLDMMNWQSPDGLRIKVIPMQSANRFSYKLVFSVPASSKLIYRLQVTAAIPVMKAQFFFDGFTEHELKGKRLPERNTILQTFPLAACWDKASGRALSLSPDTIVSDMHNGLRQSASGLQLFFATRVVVDCRRSQEVTFDSFTFHPEFGWRDAVELYYRTYPEFFRPVPGIDKRIYGIGGYFVSTHQTRDLEIHSGRQLGMTWEWSYCPWVMAGDWYVAPEDWGTGDGYMHWAHYWKRRSCSYEEYHQAEMKRFQSGDRQAAMLAYILVKDIGKKILERYPASRRVDRNGQLEKGSYLYSLPDNKDKTGFAFAYGSGLAEYLQSELRQMTDHYQISGFALDMTNWSANEYCQAQMDYGRGRSFDEQGRIFTADSILPVPFAEYIHTLKRNGKTMAVYMNHALELQPALPVFYADGVMFEGNPEMQLANFRALRLMSGQKPMSVWNSIAVKGKNNAIDWSAAQQPEVYRQISHGLAQYLLFNCLRYGVSPMNWAVAYQDGNFFRSWLPLIVDLKKAGWQVVSAVKWDGEADLWSGRFGKGRDTLFTITNPTKQPIETRLRIFERYLGTQDYQPEAVTGQKISFQKQNDFIYLDLKLQPKEIMVLRDRNREMPASPFLFSPAEQITSFFSMADAQNGAVTVVTNRHETTVIYDYLDRYYPYIQACLKKHGKPFTREPGMLDPVCNSLWRLPRSSGLTGKKQIVVGTLEDFPALSAQLSREDRQRLQKQPGAFLKVFPATETLWLGAVEITQVRQAAECYFNLLDQKMNNNMRKELK